MSNFCKNFAILIFIVLCSSPQDSFAQGREDFATYVKRSREEFAKYKSERQAEFNRYREQYNKEFAEYLRNAWKRMRPEEKVLPPPQPLPFVPKPMEDDTIPVRDVPIEIPVQDIVLPIPEPPAPQPIIIDEPKPDPLHREISLKSFYGYDIKLRCSDKIKISLADNDPYSVANAWELLSSKEFQPLVYDCQKTRQQHNYCDWMYYQFLKEVAHQVTQTDKASNESVLFTGYILAQSGVDFRFVRTRNGLLLALPFDTNIYDRLYFTIGGRRFYLIENDSPGECYIMENSFCKEATSLTLRISKPMIFGKTDIEVKRLASDRYPEMRVELLANKSEMDFYHTYPRMDWQEYSLASLNDDVAKRITKSFRPALAGKTEEESVNMILNFVQTAFTYGYDDKIWGGDRPFFADETLYYPYSDCEDRAILFSHLIRLLTNRDVVLLYYPNHLATAVHFTRDMPGDYVMVDGKKYLVCDPTGYKPIGNAYDEFKNVEAKVIKIK
jgi:hypothetical protein